MAKESGVMSKSDFQYHLQELELIPGKVEKALKSDKHILEVAKKYKDSQNCLYLGRGYNFPVALEGALKLKEISYIHAEGYPAAEMKHGPIALIDEQMPVFVIATKKGHYEKVVSNVQEIKARKGKIIGIVTEGDTDIKNIADHSHLKKHFSETSHELFSGKIILDQSNVADSYFQHCLVVSGKEKPDTLEAYRAIR